MAVKMESVQTNLEDEMEKMSINGDAGELNQTSKPGKSSKKNASTADVGPKKPKSRNRKYYKKQIRNMQKREQPTMLETIYEEPKENRYNEIHYTGQRKKRVIMFHQRKNSTLKKQQEKLQKYFGRTTLQRQPITKEEFDAKIKALDNCLRHL